MQITVYCIYFFLLLVVLLSIISLQEYSLASNDEKYFLYNNTDLGIKIQYPYDWTKEEQSYFASPSEGITNSIKFRPPEKTIVNYEDENNTLNEDNAITIKIAVKPNLPLSQEVESEIENAKSLDNFTLLHFDYNSSIVNIPAYKLVFSTVKFVNYNNNSTYSDKSSEDKTPFKSISMMFLTKIGDKIYTIKYNYQINQYSLFLPKVQKMIDTFEINKGNIFKKVNADQIPQYIIREYSNITDIVVNPNTNKLYLPQQNYVALINKITYREESRIRTNNFTGSIYFIDVDNNRIYLADPANKKIVVIDDKRNYAYNITTLSNNETFYRARHIDDFAADVGNDFLFVATDKHIYALKSLPKAQHLIDYHIVGNITAPTSTIAIDPITNRLFVGVLNNITIIDYKRLSSSLSPFHYNVIANIPLITNYEYNPDFLIFDQKTNILYVASITSNSVFVVDTNTKKVTGVIKLQSFPSGLTINPITNRMYVTHSSSNLVSIIDMSTGRIIDTIPVGSEPGPIEIDPNTNTIYVYSKGSNSFTEIDGSTNKVIAGVVFSISPSNSGHIKCDEDNEEDVSTNQYLRMGFDTPCTAMANNGFEFSNWIQNLGNNSSKTITSSTISHNSPFIFVLNALGFIKDNATTFRVTQYGNFTANFEELPPPIPQGFLIGLYTLAATVFTGWFIPNIARWINSVLQRRRMMRYLLTIDSLDKNNYHSAEPLKEHKNKITYAYAKGKINELHYELLSKRISEAEQRADHIASGTQK